MIYLFAEIETNYCSTGKLFPMSKPEKKWQTGLDQARRPVGEALAMDTKIRSMVTNGCVLPTNLVQ